MRSIADLSALFVAVAIALVITIALMRAQRGDNHRRGWITATVLVLAIWTIGAVDLLRATPHETHPAAVVVGALLPVLGALGMIRGTRPVRPWIRWPLVFLTTFALLLGGLLIGATLAPHLISAG
jgi:hypothetical protein